MKRKLISLLALLTCSALLFGCGGDKPDNSAADPAVQNQTEAPLPDFKDPAGTIGYTLSVYHFAVSEDYTAYDGGANYNYVFRHKDSKEEEAAYIGIMELAEVHMTATAFGEGMQADFETQGYENVSGEAMDINGNPSYRITCSQTTDGETVSSDMNIVCSGNGSMFLVFTAYSDESKAVYQAESDKILQSLVFFGKDDKDGATHKADSFTLTYNGDWVSTAADGSCIVLERRLAESECDYITRCKIVAKKDTTSPEKAAKNIYSTYEKEPSITELTTTESTVFGRNAWLTSCVNTSLAPHKVTMYVYYFEENGVLFEITQTYCEDVAAVTVADLNEMELK